MNSIHNNGENDKSLDAELNTIGSAYKHIEQDEPPELLDQAILNRAHRAVEKKPRRMRFSWLHGLTTTAVFVLAFSLIMNQPDTTPIPQDSVSEYETIGPGKDKEAKKRDQDMQSPEIKPKGVRQLNEPQDAPAAAAPVTVAGDSGARDRARQASAKTRPSKYVEANRMEVLEVPMMDAEVAGALEEEIQSDEAGVVADVLKVEAAYEASQRAAVAAPVEEEADMQSDAGPGIEQELQAILALKQAGDTRWKTELESFRERYPDYPLPDALTEPVP